MNKSLLLLALCPCLQGYAATASVTAPLSYTLTPSAIVYCGDQIQSSPGLGSCSGIEFGMVDDEHIPAYFPMAPSGYYRDDVTYATSSIAEGIQLTATSANPTDSTNFNLVGTASGVPYRIPYYVTYQSCTQGNPNSARRMDPSTGTINIPENESSIYSSGTGAAPCNPAAGVNPGNGSGALYFYINNGNQVTQPLPADTLAPTLYQDTLTINVTAL